MDVNFNQLDVLYKLIVERQDDIRLLQGISGQVQANQRFFDLDFNQIQQSLRQMGFKIIAIKKHDKPRSEEENKILEYFNKIGTLNLPEKIFIYKFSQNVIKLFRPDMQIIRFNQKDSRDLLLMYKQFFMAENNFEAIHLIQQFMDQEFKPSIAAALIKQLIQKSRDEFQANIQAASEQVIQKIKRKIAEQAKLNPHQSTEVSPQQEQQETPKIKLQRRPVIKRDLSVTQTKALPVFRSVSLIQQPQPPVNPERELRLQLRLQQKQMRKKFQQISKPIHDLDVDNYWCMHIILRKKFYKHPDKYFLQSGGFYLWNQLKNSNANIRVTIMNYTFQNQRIIMQDKINGEQIQEIHKYYNTTCQSPRKSFPTVSHPQIQSPGPTQVIKVTNKHVFPQIQRVQLKSTMFYDPFRDQSSMKSLSVSQDQIQEFIAKRKQWSSKELN